MGISIKNDEVERLLRRYADAAGVGVTEAVERAVRIASQVERVERTERVREEALARLHELARKGWKSSGERWTRDELHER